MHSTLTCSLLCRYGYNWQESEAEKNLLRTHTTAVSSRMLYRLAQSGFKPAKYFSVDRVFRNEDIDRTHLAEFHQIEGLICDRGLTLGDLIGTLHTFFARLGLKKIRFKPAYNPYTEPSMEIFRYGAAATSLPSFSTVSEPFEPVNERVSILVRFPALSHACIEA